MSCKKFPSDIKYPCNTKFPISCTFGRWFSLVGLPYDSSSSAMAFSRYQRTPTAIRALRLVPFHRIIPMISCVWALGWTGLGHWDTYLCAQGDIWAWYLCFYWEYCSAKGRLTPWTMKSDHGKWPFSMVRFSF